MQGDEQSNVEGTEPSGDAVTEEPSTAAQNVVDAVHERQEERAENAADEAADEVVAPSGPVESGADPAPPPEGTTSDDRSEDDQ